MRPCGQSASIRSFVILFARSGVSGYQVDCGHKYDSWFVCKDYAEFSNNHC